MCYSRLKLSRGRDTYNVNEAFPIEVFFDLRRDITALALAQYFCQLAVELVPKGWSPPISAAGAQCPALLCRGTRPQAVLKAIVELRMLSEAGYMPSIAYCAHCGAYESERMYFKVNRGEIYCKSCYLDNGDPCAPLSPAALTAMRHIVFSDFEIFSFDLSSVPGRSWLLRQRPIPCRSCSTAQDLGLLLQPAVSRASRESRQEAL